MSSMSENPYVFLPLWHSITKFMHQPAQGLSDQEKLFIGCLCVLLISLSITAGIILCIHYRSIPYLKKNILTRLDELFVQNYIFFVSVQCCICLFSLFDGNRNKYIYLFFYFILYTSLCIGFGVAIGLSCCRVLIITEVSSREHLK